MRGSIVKKGQRYYVVFPVGKKQKWERAPLNEKGRPTKKEAEKLLAQRMTELDSGSYREIKKMTFREFAENWLRDYAGDTNHIKESTASRYVAVINAHHIPFFGDYYLADITPVIVQEFISYMSNIPLQASTIQSHLAPLTKMMTHAVKWGYLRHSPMPLVERPKVRQKEMSFLSGTEVKRMVDQVPGEWYTFFLTAALTGLRLGELLAMRWKNVQWETCRYNVRERIYRGIFNTPKSDASMRSVDLSPMVLESLRTHKAMQNEMKLRQGAAYENNSLVFCRDSGTPLINPAGLRTLFVNALTDANCPIIRIHDLRHTYVALLIDQGASPKYIQGQLGHASIQMTFDIYGHLMPEAGQAVVERLDSQVFGTQ
jgi:integrase